MAAQESAFQALKSLADASRAVARGLPAQADIQAMWSGIGFSLMGYRFVAPMGEITEMLEVPHYTHLPGVQSWVCGVANVRGRLLPIFDMAAFYGDRLTSSRKQRRILVLETEKLYSGLLVDQVHGLQHFPVDEFREESGPVASHLSAFVGGSYRINGTEWLLFKPGQLARDPRFLNAARY
ncbi:chemotaxis protein CheW [Marinimicrobium alkaliphilum]|uniref:chemotaxis protein CheW n=1 Tax=Marinimicrobium alkaliphilum TaxID=2202654 RepID=UPI000DBAB1E7|nr:chemotaxis protein CheW [Marinimicrobium alkaliphilum]